MTHALINDNGAVDGPVQSLAWKVRRGYVDSFTFFTQGATCVSRTMPPKTVAMEINISLYSELVNDAYPFGRGHYGIRIGSTHTALLRLRWYWDSRSRVRRSNRD